MAQPHSRRTRAVLALAAALLFLSLPAARAFELSRVPAAAPGLVSTLWDALARLWSKEGSGLDPDGRTHTVDTGGGLDPLGQTNAASGEAGSGLDPSGRQ